MASDGKCRILVSCILQLDTFVIISSQIGLVKILRVSSVDSKVGLLSLDITQLLGWVPWDPVSLVILL